MDVNRYIYIYMNTKIYTYTNMSLVDSEQRSRGFFLYGFCFTNFYEFTNDSTVGVRGWHFF